MKPLDEQQKEIETFYWGLQEKVSKLYKISDLEAIRVAFGVVFTYNLMEARISKMLQNADMTMPGLNCLVLLAHGNPEGYPLSDLSKYLVSSRANITGVIDSLVSRKFVERVDHPADRRVIIAKITKDGRKWLDGYFPGHAKLMGSFAAPLNNVERKTVLELLGKMRRHTVKQVMEEGKKGKKS